MNRLLLLFLLFVPALLALGHDVYLFYINYAATEAFSLELLQKGFSLSALGYSWTHYSPESYQWVSDIIDPVSWALIQTALKLEAFYDGLIFGGFFTALFFVLALFDKGPFYKEGHSFSFRRKKTEKPRVSFRSGQGTGSFKYKRK